MEFIFDLFVTLFSGFYSFLTISGSVLAWILVIMVLTGHLGPGSGKGGGAA